MRHLIQNKKFWILQSIILSLFLSFILVFATNIQSITMLFLRGTLLLLPIVAFCFLWKKLKIWYKIILCITSALYSTNIIWLSICEYKEINDMYHGFEGFEIILPALGLGICAILYIILYLILFLGKSILNEFTLKTKFLGLLLIISIIITYLFLHIVVINHIQHTDKYASENYPNLYSEENGVMRDILIEEWRTCPICNIKVSLELEYPYEIHINHYQHNQLKITDKNNCPICKEN